MKMQKQFEHLLLRKQTINGFQKVNVSHQKNVGNTVLFGSDQNYKKDKKNTKCVACQHDHRVWQSNTFKEEDIYHRWEIAKKQKLCFQCLGSNHLSRVCKNSRTCRIDGFTDTHTIGCYIKRNQNKQRNQTFTSLRRSMRGSQLKTHRHQQ